MGNKTVSARCFPREMYTCTSVSLLYKKNNELAKKTLHRCETLTNVDATVIEVVTTAAGSVRREWNLGSLLRFYYNRGQ
jgi:hypothetical protein